MCRKFPICFSNSGHLKDWRFAFFFRRRKRQSIWLGKLIMKMQTFVTTNLRETVFTIQGNGLKLKRDPLQWSHLREGSHAITISNVTILDTDEWSHNVQPFCSHIWYVGSGDSHLFLPPEGMLPTLFDFCRGEQVVWQGPNHFDPDSTALF